MSATYIEAIIVTKSCTDEYSVQTETVRISNEINTDVLSSIKNELIQSGKKMVKILSLKVIPKCWGCQSEQPNQLAHMDVGGCLYVPSDDDI